MFQHLADFGYKRTPLEAVGFYLAYLLLTLAGAMIVGVTLALLFGSTVDLNGFAIGAVFSAFASAVLSYLVLREKRLLKRFSSFVWILAAAGSALLIGGIVGLLIVAYLTTLQQAAGDAV
ncbi:MAG: hypothetical protein HYS26_00460 [Candidatus Kaiserbacteria bacterium]|nr:MAG: hypothetical protein HYS26_00460 [Candidatus Kaiserbacteria bacterium]